MQVTVPDLSNLTAVQVGTLTLLLAFIDLGWNVVQAVAAKTFDPAKVMAFIESHILLRVFPILVMALLGAGAFGLPAFPAFFAAALASLALYAVETLGSVMQPPLPGPTPPAGG